VSSTKSAIAVPALPGALSNACLQTEGGTPRLSIPAKESRKGYEPPDHSSRRIGLWLRESKENLTLRTHFKTAAPEWGVLAIIVVFSLLTIVGPVTRAFLHIELNYNEGWNAYNAQAAAHRFPLYSPKYSWTTVNYPIVSFYVIGYLSRVFGDPVIIGRLISLTSLLLSSVFVALIVRKLTGNWSAAIFGASFCLTLFCTVVSGYVGMNDPQLFAHPFFLIGLLLYLGGPFSNGMILAVVALFVLGGNIKQNLIPAPLAVLIDLLVVSRTKAARFILFASVLLSASIAINMIVGGPFFISKLLAPRNYSFLDVLRFLQTYETIQVPLIISIAWSIWQIRNKKFRVIALYFLGSLFVGIAFSGGGGVSVNTYFDNFLAMSIIMGLFLDSVWQLPIPHLQKGSSWRWVPLVLLSLPLPFMLRESPYYNLRKYLSQLPVKERQFKAEVSFLTMQPGPAICESLLRCYYSGKPYVFDPFNSTNLVGFNKLNGKGIVQKIAEKGYGAIQTYIPVTEMTRPYEFFPNDILDAIDRYYQISWRDSDCVIYVPRRDST
jgi:hypothetical protein